jgi:hypothetical protein
LRVRCGGMLRQILTFVLRNPGSNCTERTGAGLSDARRVPAELTSFVPNSWIPNSGYEPLPDRPWPQGESTMQRPMERPPEKPQSGEADPPDERVVWLVPRRHPQPERMPDPPDDDDDDDPGPAAA